MIWLALSVAVTGLLAIVSSTFVVFLLKTSGLSVSSSVGSLISFVLTFLTILSLMWFVMQSTHVAPLAGSLYLGLGSMVAAGFAPAVFVRLSRRYLANA